MLNPQRVSGCRGVAGCVIVTAAGTLLAAATPAQAGTPMPRDDRWAWGENIGWINFEGQPGGQGQVRFLPAGLSGYAWAENVGWINVGQGGDYVPADEQGPPTFPNPNQRFGVRIEGQIGDAVRPLSGWAWGENIGWLNFNTWELAIEDAAGDPAGARIENDGLGEPRIRGYVWAENVGWINFDDDEHFVSVEYACSVVDLADPLFVLDLSDITAFIDAFITGNLSADFTFDGVLDLGDINTFVVGFTAGCP